MGRIDEAVTRKGPVCPQCKGEKKLRVPFVRIIQQGYRQQRIANYEEIDCGRCLGKGYIGSS